MDENPRPWNPFMTKHPKCKKNVTPAIAQAITDFKSNHPELAAWDDREVFEAIVMSLAAKLKRTQRPPLQIHIVGRSNDGQPVFKITRSMANNAHSNDTGD
jgi:hypothetical protein